MASLMMAGLVGVFLAGPADPDRSGGTAVAQAVAQAMGSRCQTPAGSCEVSPPRPVGAFCSCGEATGYVTG